MVRIVMIVALTLASVALALTTAALNRLRKQMAEEIGEHRSSEVMKHPWKIYHRYEASHPQSLLNKCHAWLSAGTLLLAFSVGAVAFCFGWLSRM